MSDVLLYNNADALTPAVAEAVEEGRQLFRQRVEPSLYDLFESAIADSRLARPVPLVTGTYRDAPPAENVTRRRSNLPVLIAVAVAVLTAAAAMFFRARP